MAVDPVTGWQDTHDTVHLHTQVIGKVRLANEPSDEPFFDVDGAPPAPSHP